MRADDPHADRGFSKAPESTVRERGLSRLSRYLTNNPITSQETPMPTPSRPGPTRDGARNLFLDADPTDDDALTEPNAPTSTHFAARRRSRGRIVAVDPCSPI